MNTLRMTNEEVIAAAKRHAVQTITGHALDLLALSVKRGVAISSMNLAGTANWQKITAVQAVNAENMARVIGIIVEQIADMEIVAQEQPPEDEE